MLTFVHVIAAVLASVRLVELLLIDRITQPLRTRLAQSYLWQCPRCLSVWSGMWVTVCFIVWPWLNWPLALSWVYITLMDWRTARRQHKLAQAKQVIGRNPMARTAVQVMQQQLSDLMAVNANLQAKLEEQAEELAKLKGQVPSGGPDRPAS